MLPKSRGGMYWVSPASHKRPGRHPLWKRTVRAQAPSSGKPFAAVTGVCTSIATSTEGDWHQRLFGKIAGTLRKCGLGNVHTSAGGDLENVFNFGVHWSVTQTLSDKKNNQKNAFDDTFWEPPILKIWNLLAEKFENKNLTKYLVSGRCGITLCRRRKKAPGSAFH